MPRKPKPKTTSIEPPHHEAPPAATTSTATDGEFVVFTNDSPTDAPRQEPLAVTEADDAFRAELGASDPTTPVSAATEAPASEPRGRFRSWVVDTTRGYTRLADEQEQRIILQFAQKPSADVLTAIKGAGFQFLPDYEGLNHVWVRRNDFETRLQVEAIEKLIGTVPSRESAPR